MHVIPDFLTASGNLRRPIVAACSDIPPPRGGVYHNVHTIYIGIVPDTQSPSFHSPQFNILLSLNS